MRKQNKSMLVLAVFVAFIAMGLFFAGMTRTAHADPPCNVCQELREIKENCRCRLCRLQGVAKTGQYRTSDARDDGALRMGVAWPDPRVTDNEDGTVTDNLTGLMWTRDVNIANGSTTWAGALSACDACTVADRSDWRLPNVRELQSIIDYGRDTPALPRGDDDALFFDNVQTAAPAYYWSSTNFDAYDDCAWGVQLGYGYTGGLPKTRDIYYVWCVRGGCGYDPY